MITFPLIPSECRHLFLDSSCFDFLLELSAFEEFDEEDEDEEEDEEELPESL